MPGLTSEQRTQLDSNIKAMLAHGAGQEDIMSYATDFKKKFESQFELAGQNEFKQATTVNPNQLHAPQKDALDFSGMNKPVHLVSNTGEPIGGTNLPDIKEAIDNASKDYAKNLGVDEATAKGNIIGAYKNGDLIPAKDSQGKSIMKRGAGLVESLTDAYTEKWQQSMDDKIFAGLSKDEAIQRMNVSMQNPNLFHRESETAPKDIRGDIGKLVGENLELLMKGTVGAMAGAASALTGGESFGTFLAMTKDLASSGYSQGVQNAYAQLKQQNPEMSDSEAYDRATKAGLANEATSLATGALLSHSMTPELPKPTVEVNGVLNGLKQSFQHAIKTSPKVIGSGVAGSLLNDAANAAVGVDVKASDVEEHAKEAAKSMAVMHFGLWALAQAPKTLASAIPSALRPQVENVVASAPREQVQQFYEAAEQKGAVPEGTTQKVLGKLSEFDAAKSIVAPFRISEENKAAIAGKLLQKKNLEQEKLSLQPNAEAFKTRLGEIDNEVKAIDKDIDKMYKAKNVYEHETDNLTGRTIGEPEDISQPIELNPEITTTEQQDLPSTENIDAEQQTEPIITPNESQEIEVIQPTENEGVTGTATGLNEGAGEADKGETISKPAEETSNTETIIPETSQPTAETGQGGDEPPIAGEPPLSETPEENSVGGVAQRIREKRAETTGVLPSQIGIGWNKENALARGRELIKSGVDPYELIKEFKKDNRLSAEDMAVFQAHAIELQRATDKAFDSGDAKAYENALFKENDFLDEVKKAQTEWSKTGVAQQGEYDFDAESFNSIKRAKSAKAGKQQEDLPPEIKESSEKVKALEQENKELQKKYEDALNKSAETGKNEGSKKYSEKAKTIADKFRKLKSKPFVFKDENGNTIDIQKMGIGWNELVELGAKAIEKTGDIADGIAEILNKIKDAEWYINLSAGAKVRLEKELQDHYNNSISGTPEAKNIKRLEKQLEDLQNGIAKQSDAVKRKLSDKEKELQDQIFEAKKNLGLIASKEPPKAKINKTNEQIKLGRLQKELEDLQQGIVKQKAEKTEDTQAIKDLKEKILEEKEKLGLRPSKMPKPEDEISPEQKNIERLQKELDRLQTEGKLKRKTDKRELTEDEKDIQSQIETEKDKIKYNNLVREFADKKDNNFTPEQSVNMWDYAKKTYINDNPDYRVVDMVNGVAMDLGLTPEQVRHALAQKPETKRLSDAIYRNQYEKNKAHKTIQNWVNKTPDSSVKKLLETIASPFRGLATLGHGHALLFTHAGMNLFDPQVAKQFLLASAKQFKLVYGNSANFEKAKTDLRKDPLFDAAVRAGLAVDPNTIYDDWQLANTFLKKLSIQGNKGFLVLKMMRMEIFKNEYKHLSAIEKADPETLKQVAKNANHWTGTAGSPVSPFANAFIFAPNLIISKFARLTTDPIRAISGLRKNASLDEKAASKIILKKTGRIMASYAAALAANSAMLSLVGSTQKVNYTQPQKSDWLKFKTGDALTDKTVDVSSGMVSTTQFLAQIAMLPFESQKEVPEDYYGARSAGDALNNQVAGFTRKMLSPFGSTVWDNISHTDYAGNVLPWFDDKPKGSKRKLEPWEYAAEKIPIPLAEAVKVIHDQMIEEGVDTPTAKNIAGGLIIGAIASAGVKIGNAPKERPTPFNEADNKDPVFKYWLDKGMSLPNTSLSSEKVVINNKSTTISKLSKQKQDEYSSAHKENIKSELSRLEERDYVFVKPIKEENGEQLRISFNYPSEGTADRIALKDLTTAQKAKVLSIAQKKATTKTKADLFKYNDVPDNPDEEQK